LCALTEDKKIALDVGNLLIAGFSAFLTIAVGVSAFVIRLSIRTLLVRLDAIEIRLRAIEIQVAQLEVLSE